MLILIDAPQAAAGGGIPAPVDPVPVPTASAAPSPDYFPLTAIHPFGTAEAGRERVSHVLFKYRGVPVDVVWYMDQPYREITPQFPGKCLVCQGRFVKPDDTPQSLVIYTVDVLFLVDAPQAAAGGHQ